MPPPGDRDGNVEFTLYLAGRDVVGSYCVTVPVMTRTRRHWERATAIVNP